jgi:hypothetical protein
VMWRPAPVVQSLCPATGPDGRLGNVKGPLAEQDRTSPVVRLGHPPVRQRDSGQLGDVGARPVGLRYPDELRDGGNGSRLHGKPVARALEQRPSAADDPVEPLGGGVDPAESEKPTEPAPVPDSFAARRWDGSGES